MKVFDNVTRLDRETAGTLHGLAAVAAWSLSMVGTRACAPILGGPFVGLGRGVVGAVLAGIVIVITRAPFPPRSAWPGLVVVAAGSVIGFPLLAALAMAQVPASHGLLFAALLPGCTAVVAVVRHGESTRPRFWVGAAAAAGLVLGWALHAGAGALEEADVLLVAGMGMSAVAYAEGGRLAGTVGGLATVSWSLVFALPVTLPLWTWVWVHDPPAGPPAAWAAFAYVAVFSSYVGFVFWYRAMSLGGIARTSQVQTVQPLLGLAWSALLLGEPVSPGLVATAVAVIACVAWGRRPERLAAPAPRAHPGRS